MDGVDPDIQSGKEIIKLLEKYLSNGSIKYDKKLKMTSGEGEGIENSENNNPSYKVSRKRNVETQKKSTTEVKRPIILICKNIYNRNLTQLKKIGITFKIRKPDSKKMLDRLTEI